MGAVVGLSAHDDPASSGQAFAPDQMVRLCGDDESADDGAAAGVVDGDGGDVEVSTSAVVVVVAYK